MPKTRLCFNLLFIFSFVSKGFAFIGSLNILIIHHLERKWKRTTPFSFSKSKKRFSALFSFFHCEKMPLNFVKSDFWQIKKMKNFKKLPHENGSTSWKLRNLAGTLKKIDLV